MDRVKGKVAIVTGVGNPIGRVCATLLAQEGAAVMATDAGEQAAAATGALIRGRGGRAEHRAHDVADAEAWRQVVAATEQAFGRIDIVVNAAQAYLKKSIRDTSLAELRKLDDVNFVGCWLGAKYAIPAMRASGGGSFISVTSVTGQIGVADAAAYGALAGAVRIFTQSLALECGEKKDGIRVNAILAGPEAIAALPVSAGGVDGVTDMPAPLGDSEHTIGQAMIFLAADEARFVTASAIVIDQDYSAGREGAAATVPGGMLR